MKIAIHVADLDADRIDGTRVYILNMLKHFGRLDPTDDFLLYHKADFNPALNPPRLANYEFKKLPFPWFWTQTRFAWQLFWDKPEILWMPVHNVPIFRRKKMKVVVTIHDLAFKHFPQYFPEQDLVKLNRLSDLAIRNADKIIAISASTKRDILHFYPKIKAKKVVVVPHGFDVDLFQGKISEQTKQDFYAQYGLEPKKYLLYVGAIQPRKNLGVLIEAFEKIKTQTDWGRDFKLMLAGAPAWMSEGTLAKIAASPFAKDIIVSGTVPFEQLPTLYRGAATFVFPTLYEGFGIPVLEALASGTPTVLANNSSLPEVSGGNALFFETDSSDDLQAKITELFSNAELREKLGRNGKLHATNYTWRRCAKRTLKVLSEL